MIHQKMFSPRVRVAVIQILAGLALFFAVISSGSAQTNSLPASGGQQLDPASLEALMKTMEMMQDPTQREHHLREQGGKAQRVDQNISNLVRTEEQKQAIYVLAAQILQKMVSEHKGDPAALQKAVQEGMKNPEVFFKNLTPEQRAQIQSLSKDIGRPPASSGR